MKLYRSLYNDLPTPQEMARWDAVTIKDYGHPATMLMETASRGVLHVLLDHLQSLNTAGPLASPSLTFLRDSISQTTPILVYIGTGNNGGDGIALARHLHELRYPVMLLAVKALDKLPSPAREHWEMAQKSRVPFAILPPDAPTFMPKGFTSPGVIVDAIMGMGLNKALTPFLQKVVAHINTFAERCHIIAMDIPSGLCGLTGKALPVAVRAQTTVTFEARKPGLAFPASQKHTGKVIVHSIGIPQDVKDSYSASYRVLQPCCNPLIDLGDNLHKGSAGRVLIIGGSQGMEGAPVLTAHGALRTGSGLVKILCPQGVVHAIRPWGMEFLLHGVGQHNLSSHYIDAETMIPNALGLRPSAPTTTYAPNGDWQEEIREELLASIADFAPDVIIMGMGMGRTPGVARAINAVLNLKERCPVVLDADALFALAHEKDYGLNLRMLLTERDIITPHPLEAARLLPATFYQSQSIPKGSNTSQLETVQQDRSATICALTAETKAVTVLKGAGTLIKQGTSPVILAPYDVPSLAVAGSGDVLAGVIGSLVARNSLTSLLSPIDMASLGVYLHAQAGMVLAKTRPQGNLAHEIADAIPQVVAPFVRR